jgi:hypothetical protein
VTTRPRRSARTLPEYKKITKNKIKKRKGYIFDDRENTFSVLKVLFFSVQVLFLSVKILFLSVKILFLSVEILFFKRGFTVFKRENTF